MRSLALLAIALLFAGCIGGGGTPDEPAAGAQAPTAEAATADLATADANATEEVPTPIAVPFTYTGSSPVGACAPTGTCEWASGGSESYHVIEHTGHATRLAVQVTYDGQLPGMDLYVGVCVGDEESGNCGDYRTGPSPLVLEFELADHVPGQVVALNIGSVSTTAATAGVLVLGPANFEAVGTLTVMPMP